MLGVMERRLAGVPYLAGSDYTIADIAAYPWVMEAKTAIDALLGDTFARSPATADWIELIGSRPAVKKGAAERPSRYSQGRPATAGRSCSVTPNSVTISADSANGRNAIAAAPLRSHSHPASSAAPTARL